MSCGIKRSHAACLVGSCFHDESLDIPGESRTSLVSSNKCGNNEQFNSDFALSTKKSSSFYKWYI